MSAEEASGSSQSVLQTVAWAKKYGFRAVPIHPGSKAAISRRYLNPDYESPGEEYWRGANYNIGVALGPKVKGPVDVDLDCPEALFFGRLFLPKTPAVFGRKSKPASHYLYMVDEPEFPKKAFVDPIVKDDVTIVELRGDAHQTVMPGSIHETSGEEIRWETVAFPEIPAVDVEVLGKAVRRIAIATLIVRHMWLDGMRNEVNKHLAGLFYYLDWPIDDTFAVIDAVMEYTGDTDKTRRTTITNTYVKAEKGGKVVGANALRKFMGSTELVDRILEWGGNETVNVLAEYNQRWCVVSLEGKFRIVDTEVEPGCPPVFYLKDDFLNMMSTDYVTVDGKPVSKAKLWIANPRRRTAWDVDFVPGVDHPERTLNLWTGWATEPKAGDCSGWFELLDSVVCGDDEETANWMRHWFANILMEPRSKPLTAPVLIGTQGAGKSLLLAYFGRILGPSYTVITNEEHIYGRFNRHLASTLLLHSEEALYGGEKKHRGIIKSLITDEFRIFEQKGVDARQVRNYLRLVLTSNEQHAAPAEAGDRRFTVIDMAGRKIPPALTRKVLEEMRGGGPAALYYYLTSTFRYDPLVPRVNLKNAALAALKTVNFGPIESWWYELLGTGSLLPDYLSWAQKPKDKRWPRVVSSTALYTACVMRMRELNAKIPTQAMFSLMVDKMTGRKLTRRQMFFQNPHADGMPPMVAQLSDRHSGIEDMPSLDICRGAFAAFIGQPMDWPDDIDDEHRKY